MSEQSTPGPWRWGHFGIDLGAEHQGYALGCLDGPDNTSVLSYGMDGEEDIYAENPADAWLIAAAPDLLAACEDTLAYLQRPLEARWQDIDQAITTLRDAIAKARGERG
jgi:hypothetical protein